MEISQEKIRDYLPYYLTEEDKVGVAKELSNFHLDKMEYFLRNRFQDEMLQGDGWTRLALRNLETGEKILVNGVVLSNSCDVASGNKRELPVNIIFAPLVPIQGFVSRLRQAGVSERSIDNKLAAIRRQRVTNLFYLPAEAELGAEHIVVLDDVHTMPATLYQKEASGKIFTLGQAGFYLFILKLSIHFCRFHENVRRNVELPAARVSGS